MNKHWNRWIHTSIAKYFSTIASSEDIYFYIAGRTDGRTETNEFIELQVTGPYTTEISRNNFKLDVIIDLIYSIHLLPSDTYKSQKISGVLEEAITDICIYKYGNGEDDDDTFLGTLKLQRQPVESNCFGQVEPNTRLIQGNVSAALQMRIKT